MSLRKMVVFNITKSMPAALRIACKFSLPGAFPAVSAFERSDAGDERNLPRNEQHITADDRPGL